MKTHEIYRQLKMLTSELEASNPHIECTNCGQTFIPETSYDGGPKARETSPLSKDFFDLKEKYLQKASRQK